MIRHAERPVYTCGGCVNSYAKCGELHCPIFGCRVRPGDKACIYRDTKTMGTLPPSRARL